MVKNTSQAIFGRKRFGIYSGMYTPLGGLIFILVLFVSTAYALYPQHVLLIWISVALFTFACVLSSLPLWTYAVILEGSTLRETGFLSPRRTMSIESIHKVSRADYSFGMMIDRQHNSFLKKSISIAFQVFSVISWFTRNPIFFHLSTPMISFAYFEGGDFPAFPINPEILMYLQKVNPSITVDTKLVDILPRHIQKAFDLKLSVTDIIGLWIWRLMLSILFLLVLSIFTLIAMKILGVHF